MSSTLSVDSTVVVAPQQVSANLADEGVILNLKDGVYYGLDPVGARIWSLIQQPKTVAEVRDTIHQEYAVEIERCQRDVLRLLGELADRGLIEVKGGQAEQTA